MKFASRSISGNYISRATVPLFKVPLAAFFDAPTTAFFASRSLDLRIAFRVAPRCFIILRPLLNHSRFTDSLFSHLFFIQLSKHLFNFSRLRMHLLYFRACTPRHQCHRTARGHMPAGKGSWLATAGAAATAFQPRTGERARLAATGAAGHQ